ncbi:MAG TPA: ABC-F family ATP-binding cassette domain-containing protein [Vicinamibacterales bacterium]|nr:ABC-F family ATP-binding cassette domain-containing protein [Vicinamibacterales bacterium]
MLQLQDVTKAFGEKTLLEHVTWQVGDRDRVGLCGPNGAGKTTLLKMLAGLDEPDSGIIQKPNALTLGYLPQDGLSHSGRTVRDEASLALKPLLDLKEEMHALEARLGDTSLGEAEHDAVLMRYSEVQDRFRLSDGYQIELKVATVLRGLGFEPEAQLQLTDHLSGGWQMRLALAKLLLSQPDLLLLDEPTNHLDLEARNWLEEYLVAYPHAVILVSHDRYFLDAVVTHIADLTLRKITEYHTNYTRYLEQRDAAIERLREAKRRQDEEIQRVEEFINRFRYQATKAAQVQSRIKMLEKVERLEVPPERKRIHFQFPAAPKSGRMVLELQHVRKAYGDKVVLDDVTLHVERGDRIALVGHNGAGKSTLMRILSGEETPDAGTRSEGHQVVMQYFAQDEATRLNPALTVYETMSADSPHTMVPAIRNILGGFLFSGDDIYKKAGVLSGGERTRLAVARMLLRPSNTLLLDEPTNHLDIDSKEVLLDALADYGGTLIFVSHDRYFVEKLATKIVEVGEGKATLYPGTYEAFLWRKEHRDAPGNGPSQPAAPGKTDTAGRKKPSGPAGHPVAAPTAAPGLPAQSYDDRKREGAEKRKRERAFKALQTRLADMEARIADREKQIKDLEQAMAAPDFYSNHEKSKPVLAQHQALMWEVGELLAQWEMLQAETEQYGDLRNQ